MINKLAKVTLYVCMIVAGTACSEFNLRPPEPVQKTIQVKVAEYCPENGAALTHVFALNLSAYNTNDGFINDEDRDGLSNTYEQNAGTQANEVFSACVLNNVACNYTDLFIANMSFDFDQQSSLRICDVLNDTDRDQLNDCEEDILGTDYLNPDTDTDGIPDGVEFRYGLNPIDDTDSYSDLDGDYIMAIDEIKKNTLISTSISLQKNKTQQSYEVNTVFNEVTFETCYEVTVKNIPIVNVNNGNQIRIIFEDTLNVPGQGQVMSLRDTTVIASRGLPQGYMVNVDTVSNQTVFAGL